MISDKIHEFSRGASFEVIMSLPSNIAENYFQDWTATAQLRRVGQITDKGFIADLTLTWVDGRKFTLVNDITADWPLGDAELDVLFSQPNTNRKIRTKKLRVKISHGVTAA